MAEVYGYFNGLEYDEKFPMMRVASLITTGVYNDSLHVSAGTGLNVYVAAGKAWVNGYFYSSDATKQITIDIADADNTRKDIIVLRLDTVNRLMTVAYKKGNPSVYPTPPTLQRNNDLYELQLAEILVPAGSASIGAATITDTRPDSGLCGITAGFQGLDVAGLTAQAQAKFDTWFAGLKNQLDSNQAGNLQNQIDTHKTDKSNPHGVTAAQTGSLSLCKVLGTAHSTAAQYQKETQTITLGFKPKHIRITAVFAIAGGTYYSSTGVYSANIATCVYKYGAADVAPGATSHMVYMHSGSSSAYGDIGTITDTGFTLTWGVENTPPVGDVKMIIEAFG